MEEDDGNEKDKVDGDEMKSIRRKGEIEGEIVKEL